MSIKVENISFTYDKKTPNSYEALKNVSLEIKDHSFTGIVGHTGSGKSTLVQMLNGLLMPNEGRIIVDNFVLEGGKKKPKNIRELRKHVGLVFQFPEYQLFEESVIKDVAFGPKNFGKSEADAINEAKLALAKVGIGEEYFERSPFELSGGEKRRIAIAGILAINPDILVLDEPTAGLDAQGTRQILDLIASLNKEGKTIIIVTHDMNVVISLSKRAIVLENGMIKFDGSPFDLFKGDDFGLELPEIYHFINILNAKGYDIPLNKIRTIDDLLPYLKGERQK